MSKDVLIKGVEEETYRRAKAAAALEGLSMGEAVNEALRLWVDERKTADLSREYTSDLNFVRKNWDGSLKRHRGKAVVISIGKLQGIFDAYAKAREFSKRFEVALVFVVDNRPIEGDIEIGPELEV
jgi:hypothetical protein